MALLTEVPGMGAAEDRMTKAFSFPVGAASPLWLAFGAATSVGLVYWWMTRWAAPSNLEAAFALAERPLADAGEVIEIIAEAVEEEVDEAVEVMAQVALTPLPGPPLLTPPILPTADDLTRIVGIGPKLAEALVERGVTSFAQIAAWTADELAAVDEALSLRGRAVRDAWMAQAARMAGGSRP